MRLHIGTRGPGLEEGTEQEGNKMDTRQEEVQCSFESCSLHQWIHNRSSSRHKRKRSHHNWNWNCCHRIGHILHLKRETVRNSIVPRISGQLTIVLRVRIGIWHAVEALRRMGLIVVGRVGILRWTIRGRLCWRISTGIGVGRVSASTWGRLSVARNQGHQAHQRSHVGNHDSGTI